jgi:hypothetical protein
LISCCSKIAEIATHDNAVALGTTVVASEGSSIEQTARKSELRGFATMLNGTLSYTPKYFNGSVISELQFKN